MTKGEDGFALVTVLAVVLLLSLLAASLVSLARSEGRELVVARNRSESNMLQEAAINRAILGLTDKRPTERWRYDGAARHVDLPGGTVEVTVLDEAARIDLNTADDALLRSLFTALGKKPEEATSLVDAIRDWTDEDDLRRLNGAEADDYRAAGLSYVPRNQPFASIDELNLVKGVTPDLVEAARPALTLYSGRRTADARYAGALVRKALGVDSDTVQPGLVESGAPQPVIEDLGGRAFRITVRLVGIKDAVREEVIRITGDPRNPVWTQAFENKVNSE